MLFNFMHKECTGIVGVEPNAIAVFSGGIKQDASGRWVSTDLTKEDDTLGAPGGKLRVLAAAVVSNQYPSAAVIATGNKGYDVPAKYPADRPLLCEILKSEFIEAGVPVRRIMLEKKSHTTYQQISALAVLMAEHGWNRTAVVTSRWHIPRTRAIIERKFSGLADSIELIAAEDVLIAHDKRKWESTIARAYASGWLARRIENEEKGIRQIKEGTYDFK